jgi:hypothetical protein
MKITSVLMFLVFLSASVACLACPDLSGHYVRQTATVRTDLVFTQVACKEISGKTTFTMADGTIEQESYTSPLDGVFRSYPETNGADYASFAFAEDRLIVTNVMVSKAGVLTSSLDKMTLDQSQTLHDAHQNFDAQGNLTGAHEILFKRQSN